VLGRRRHGDVARAGEVEALAGELGGEAGVGRAARCAHHAQAEPAAAVAALAAADVARDRDEREQLGRRAHDRARHVPRHRPRAAEQDRERPDGHRAAQHRGGEATVVVAGRPVGAGRGGRERAAARVEVGRLGAAQQRPDALHERALGVGLVQGVEQYPLHRGEPPQGTQVGAHRGARHEGDDLPERRLERHGDQRQPAQLGLLDERRRRRLVGDAEPEAQRGHAAVGERADEPALGALVLAELYARGEHHPVGLEPAHGVGQVDRVAAQHERRARRLAARAQLEAERAVVEQIAERQPHALGPPDEPRAAPSSL
jgi:hypothetical protein